MTWEFSPLHLLLENLTSGPLGLRGPNWWNRYETPTAPTMPAAKYFGVFFVGVGLAGPEAVEAALTPNVVSRSGAFVRIMADILEELVEAITWRDTRESIILEREKEKKEKKSTEKSTRKKMTEDRRQTE